MDLLPTELTIATLQVLIMPDGEIVCGGHHIGWFKDLKKYLKADNG